MNVTLSPEFEDLVNEKLRTGEFRSAEEVVNVALRLLKERDEDRTVVEEVNSGEALPADERFHARLAVLLEEAEKDGPPVEMTEKDWDDIRRQGTALLQSRKPA